MSGSREFVVVAMGVFASRFTIEQTGQLAIFDY
jgi:hypothetical protein